ncbi:hypothetical protein [Bradyrhizobium sp. CCGUVB23]|uniref:hypothetical protein n=1 Tax=Bradyrhizobium sp. CCGUVB23 TaxID=2949630 RepID=UPI0020B2FF80|nr:hypothetical protein [Bradyrhizobium sp. CCGUVB23]MCP3461088.1 hypothetical protein [Bradyrhizobium sp. CCGUVB23]
MVALTAERQCGPSESRFDQDEVRARLDELIESDTDLAFYAHSVPAPATLNSSAYPED